MQFDLLHLTLSFLGRLSEIETLVTITLVHHYSLQSFGKALYRPILTLELGGSVLFLPIA